MIRVRLYIDDPLFLIIIVLLRCNYLTTECYNIIIIITTIRS